MCWMILLTVGWKSSFMASQDILSMPWEDHFTKFTLWESKGQGPGVRVCQGAWHLTAASWHPNPPLLKVLICACSWREKQGSFRLRQKSQEH